MPLPERALIAQIRQVAGRRPRSAGHAILAGIGDDCAVLRIPPSDDTLVTTDFSLEGVHFRREWHPAEAVGHRCLARGLSDIAAMGGRPLAVFLSLALPKELSQSWVKAFTRGLIDLAAKHGAMLAGGDTAGSPAGILADIVVVGTVPRRKAILRSGARPGDLIFVSGQLGASAAALTELRAHPKTKLDPSRYSRHFYPEPRIELGRILRDRRLVSAMIDTSDGLSTDLSHICEESGVGAEIDPASIPRARVGKPRREVELELALHGGEDYELLFTVPPGKKIPSSLAGVPITCIGQITRRRKIVLHVSGGKTHELRPQGWEHFSQ